MTQLIETIFKDELTQQGLEELRNRFPSDLVMDMSDDNQFKQARKIRTERNKLKEAIDRRRKDVTGEIKEYGDNLISQVTDIVDVVVSPFEVEDKRRKEEAARLKAIEEEKINESRKQIAGINGFVSQCNGKDSAYIADMIESVDLIEVESFHKDVIHEAIEAKKAALSHLTQMLSDTKARERLAEEEAKLAEERRKMEAERAEFEAWKNQQAAEQKKREEQAKRDAEEKARFDAEAESNKQYVAATNQLAQEAPTHEPKEEVQPEPQAKPAPSVVRQEQAPSRQYSVMELNAMDQLAKLVEEANKPYASDLREFVESVKANNLKKVA